jgi:hypothetical protein
MKQALLKTAAELASWVPDALLVAGGVAVSYGASLVYEPAGYVVGGLFLLAAGWLTARGAK